MNDTLDSRTRAEIESAVHELRNALVPVTAMSVERSFVRAAQRGLAVADRLVRLLREQPEVTT